MANEILVKDGTQIAFGVSASFNPADDGTNFVTDLSTIGVAITLASVANEIGRAHV